MYTYVYCEFLNIARCISSTKKWILLSCQSIIPQKGHFDHMVHANSNTWLRPVLKVKRRVGSLLGHCYFAQGAFAGRGVLGCAFEHLLPLDGGLLLLGEKAAFEPWRACVGRGLPVWIAIHSINIYIYMYVCIYIYIDIIIIINCICIYIYATHPEPMFQKLRPCLKAYCHVAMIWAKKTAGAVDDTAKMMSSSPKQNDMLFFCNGQYPKVNWQGGLW